MLFQIGQLSAQERFLPKIKSYNSHDYAGGFQNWNIAEDANHMMYFANAEGVLIFNGYYWQLKELPNKSVVRSLKLASNGRFYIGGQNELGYLERDSTGEHTYRSLKNLLPATERFFSDVWNTEIYQGDIFFREPGKIMLYRPGDSIKVLKPEGSWSFLGQSRNQLFAQDSKIGLLKYQPTGWRKIAGNEALNHAIITAIIPLENEDDYLITTQEEGLFRLQNSTLHRFSTPTSGSLLNHVYAARLLKNGNIACGTLSHGLVIIDPQGNPKWTYNKSTGILSNKIRDIYEDKDENIWLAMEYGLSLITTNKAISYIVPDAGKELTGYASLFQNGEYWLGTSDGVYRSKAKKDEYGVQFDFIQGTEGQVWNLQNIRNKVLISHDKGLLSATEEGTEKLYNHPGTWLVLDQIVSNNTTPYYLAGTYSGILKFGSFTPISITDSNRFSNVRESSRFVHYDPTTQTLWTSHPSRGVYQFDLENRQNMHEDPKRYGKAQGLPSNENNYIFGINEHIFAATEDGIYLYSTLEKKFIPHPILYKLTKGIPIQYINQDKQQNIWIASEKKIYIFRKEKDDYTLHGFPELDGKIVGGHVSINLQRLDQIIIGTSNGFVQLDLERYKVNRPVAFLHTVQSAHADKPLLTNHFYPSKVGDQFSYKQNSLHFEYGVTEYAYQENIEFTCQLKGFDEELSPWSEKHEKNYTNLPPGQYTFLIKARFGLNNESDAVEYTFEILPPWYQTKLAYLLYCCVIIFTLFLFFKLQRAKYERRHEQERALHLLRLESSEKEIIRLNNEKLAAEVIFKDKELSAMTLHLLKRAEVLDRLKQVIKDANKKDVNSKETFPTLLRMIRNAEKSEEEHRDFNHQFNEANRVFFEALRAQYPALTMSELKLCALLKMELSTKEIAQLLHISIKAVEVARYRLRKKLELEGSTKLYVFLQQFSNQDQ